MKGEQFTAVGIDVGGTKVAAGVVTFPEGKLWSKAVIRTEARRGGEAVLHDVQRLAKKLANDSEGAGNKVKGIGLGLCELVDPLGRILSANCIHWLDQPVAEQLGELAPLVIEADVRAAALAEALFGAGRSFHIFLFITVGTGISSCLMVEGEPFLGARGATGTMASSPITWACEKCGFPANRTLEEVASGPGLVARLNKRCAGSAQSGEDVLVAASQGNVDARDVIQSAGESLGSAVGLLVNVLDPEAIIIGGGLGLSEGLYWESLVASTRRHIWSEVHRELPILRAGTGQNAGIIGAAAAAWKKFGGAVNRNNPFRKSSGQQP
jgi:glucokinase